MTLDFGSLLAQDPLAIIAVLVWSIYFSLTVARLVLKWRLNDFRSLGTRGAYLALLGLWIVIGLSLFLTIPFESLQKISLPLFAPLVGLIFILAALHLSKHAYHALGLSRAAFFYSIDMKTKDIGKKQIVMQYPFNIIRHPVYLGQVLFMLGLFLGLGHVLLLWAAALSVFVNVATIIPEERELRERFGSSYERYASRVQYRLIPFIH